MVREDYIHNPFYTDVRVDPTSGGMVATHILHHFDRRGGVYEKMVLQAGLTAGHTVILEAEDDSRYGERNVDGLWDGMFFEVVGCETATANNILRGLKHCASKVFTEVAVLVFPWGGFNEDTMKRVLRRYNGLAKLVDGQFVGFKQIICVQGGLIVCEYDV